MVGMFYLLPDGGVLQAAAQRFRNVDVIDAPSLVIGAGVCAEAPPAVLMRFGVELAEGVDKPAVEQFGKPGPFFGQEAGGIFVADGIVNIDGLVRDVIIAGNHQVGPFLAELLKVTVELVEPLVFIGLSFFSRGAGREICVDEGNVPEIGPYDPAFGIALHIAVPVLHVVGFYFGKDSHAAISFFLRGVPVIRVAELFELLEIHVFAMGFYFLQTDNVRGISFEPFGESFCHGGAESVNIIGDDPHDEIFQQK